ncbi:MAG: class I SAM-dependent methyltransferase [Trueperaceae bacterium]|nr:MAG: class I SAM-dependent methyltransferase [Trueperaceae bacterium]
MIPLGVPNERFDAVAAAYRDAGRLQARIAFHERFGGDVPDLHRRAWDRIDAPDDARVLEIGVGTGKHWRVNRDRVPPRWRATLTDRSPGMLDEARRALADTLPNASFEVADAMALSFEDASFDLAFAHHMLYHTTDPSVAAAELRRVLRPGSALHALTNGAAHLAEVHALAADVATAWPHVRVDTPDALSFTAENGATCLGAAFDHVERVVFDDALLVNEAEPLADYLASLVYIDDDALHGPVRAWLAAFARERLACGALVVHRACALFIAS